MISLRIAGRYGGESQEIVLHSGPSQGNGSKSHNDSPIITSLASSVSSETGPSDASSISSTLCNVAQIIAGGKLIIF